METQKRNGNNGKINTHKRTWFFTAMTIRLNKSSKLLATIILIACVYVSFLQISHYGLLSFLLQNMFFIIK